MDLSDPHSNFRRSARNTSEFPWREGQRDRSSTVPAIPLQPHGQLLEPEPLLPEDDDPDDELLPELPDGGAEPDDPEEPDDPDEDLPELLELDDEPDGAESEELGPDEEPEDELDEELLLELLELEDDELEELEEELELDELEDLNWKNCCSTN
jgi:hypothetical protein